MPTLYMIVWSVVMILVLGLGRLRHMGKLLIMALVTAVILVLSQSLFVQLSISAGLDPSTALQASNEFLQVGPLGWMALLVMPCGWLGPIIGLNLVQRRTPFLNQAA